MSPLSLFVYGSHTRSFGAKKLLAGRQRNNVHRLHKRVAGLAVPVASRRATKLGDHGRALLDRSEARCPRTSLRHGVTLLRGTGRTCHCRDTRYFFVRQQIEECFRIGCRRNTCGDRSSSAGSRSHRAYIYVHCVTQRMAICFRIWNMVAHLRYGPEPDRTLVILPLVCN